MGNATQLKTQSRPNALVCDLESVIVTAELDRRCGGRIDPGAESRALLSLTRALARSPKNFFGLLVKTALELTVAGSTGISLLNKKERRFVWPAVAGRLKSYIGSGTPSDFGPCGTVLERNTSLLLNHPERHFTYLAAIVPPLVEVLLVPFHLDGEAVGTIWAVSHARNRQFSSKDRQLLESLSTFAATAYEELARNGALEPYLNMGPAAEEHT